MFVEFFYHLRRRGLPVSLGEWMSLMEALSVGLAQTSLDGFYSLCRSLCVKHESHFDLYDQCFAEYFAGVEPPASVKDEVLQWLKAPKTLRDLSEEEKHQLQELDPETLKDLFEKRLKEQTERHDGGSKWIGTGGTSPFGHGGYHPSGLRVSGSGLRGKAMQVAAERRFRNLRGDQVLDTRQISLALKKLRRLTRGGAAEELDIEASIDATARSGGEIELRWRRSRRNNVKLCLLMDVGGSMTPHTQIMESLFSAANRLDHFQDFKVCFFHNCPYEVLFHDMERLDTVPTQEFLSELDDSWHLMMVGDAAMSPYELTVAGGSVDYFHYNDEPGLVWLQRIKNRVPRSVWLNPNPDLYWAMPSTQLILQVFPDMYPLTMEGLQNAVTKLKGKWV